MLKGSLTLIVTAVLCFAGLARAQHQGPAQVLECWPMSTPTATATATMTPTATPTATSTARVAHHHHSMASQGYSPQL